MQSAHSYVDGEFVVPSGIDAELCLRSPADQSDELGRLAWSHCLVEETITAARRSLVDWRRQSLSQRTELLRRYQQRLRHHQAAIAHTIAREVGKPLWEAQAELQSMIAKVDLTLGPGLDWTADQHIDGLAGEIRFRPHGVVAVVGPFNFPGHLPNGHLVPALLLGNAVICKPSDKAPFTGEWLARCMAEAGVPPGVFQLLQGDATVAKALVEHPQLDGVLFTGSAAVGRDILATCAAQPGKLIALELGGKNSSIALDDCDLEWTARQLAFSAYVSAGQRCTATSRLYVTRRIAAALVDRLTNAARSLRVGYPLDAGVFMGPVISEARRDAVIAATQQAAAAGMQAVVSSQAIDIAERHGWYLRPSLHLSSAALTPIVGYSDQELFGPDLAVYEVDDLDAAISAANASDYGLIGAVFTASRQSFEHAADGLRVGVLHHNRGTAGASGRLPFGGLKNSGNHRPAGIMATTSCAYPLSLWHSPDTSALPDWPGLYDVGKR